MLATQKQLKAEDILGFFLGNNEELDTAIKCGKGSFTTTDAELYAALGSMQPYDTFNHRLLVKFLEMVAVHPAEKFLLTEHYVEQLRKAALRGGTHYG